MKKYVVSYESDLKSRESQVVSEGMSLEEASDLAALLQAAEFQETGRKEAVFVLQPAPDQQRKILP
jgi:hypothetical protein